MKILTVDDHAMMRDGLRLILESQEDMCVVGEAQNGREAVRLAKSLRPDIVIMDIAMAELNGIEATRRITDICPGTKVVILTMHSSAEHIYRALKSGATGFVLKESAGRELVTALRIVHKGKRYLSQEAASVMTDDYLERCDSSAHASPLERLSPREREVLQLVAEGRSSKEIGDAIHISPKSVDTYRSRLMQKLAVDNLAGLIKFAINHGLTKTK